MIDVKIDTSSSYAMVGDILTYMITIKNKSDLIIEDIIIKSTLDEQLKFILNSVTIDNLKDEEANITSGISVGRVPPNDIKKIVFNVRIIKKIYEMAQVKFIGEYKYPTEDNNRKYLEIFECELKELKIYNPKINIEFNSDMQEVKLNDEITYFLDIHNTGELDLINLYLVNEVPSNIEIIEGSFYIDDKCINSVNMDKGITLGFLKRNEHKKILYKAKIISGIGRGKIINSAKVIYGFNLNGVNIYKESEKKETSVLMGISNFKLINISDNFFVKGDNISLESIDEIIPEIIIEKYKIIKTQKGKSLDKQNSNRYKLIIHGVIKEVIKYEVIANSSTIKVSHCQSQFSTYVVLPKDFVIGTNLELDTQIDNINFYVTSKNSYFRNIGFLIIVKISKYK